MTDTKIPRMDVLKYMDTGQVNLPSTTLATKIVTLRGGQAVIIKALVGNADNIYVGKKDVTSSIGFELSAGESLKIEYLPDKVVEEFITIYATSATSGDDVCFVIVP